MAQDRRYSHDTALPETMGARRATKLHVDEREQLPFFGISTALTGGRM